MSFIELVLVLYGAAGLGTGTWLIYLLLRCPWHKARVAQWRADGQPMTVLVLAPLAAALAWWYVWGSELYEIHWRDDIEEYA